MRFNYLFRLYVSKMRGYTSLLSNEDFDLWFSLSEWARIRLINWDKADSPDSAGQGPAFLKTLCSSKSNLEFLWVNDEIIWSLASIARFRARYCSRRDVTWSFFFDNSSPRYFISKSFSSIVFFNLRFLLLRTWFDFSNFIIFELGTCLEKLLLRLLSTFRDLLFIPYFFSDVESWSLRRKFSIFRDSPTNPFFLRLLLLEILFSDLKFCFDFLELIRVLVRRVLVEEGSLLVRFAHGVFKSTLFGVFLLYGQKLGFQVDFIVIGTWVRPLCLPKLVHV